MRPTISHAIFIALAMSLIGCGGGSGGDFQELRRFERRPGSYPYPYPSSSLAVAPLRHCPGETWYWLLNARLNEASDS